MRHSESETSRAKAPARALNERRDGRWCQTLRRRFGLTPLLVIEAICLLAHA